MESCEELSGHLNNWNVGVSHWGLSFSEPHGNLISTCIRLWSSMWWAWGAVLFVLWPRVDCQECAPFSTVPKTSADLVRNGWDLSDIQHTKESFPLSRCAAAGSSWYGSQLRNGLGTVKYRFKTFGVATLDVGNCWDTGIVGVVISGIEIGTAEAETHSMTLRFMAHAHDLLELRVTGAVMLHRFALECQGSNLALHQPASLSSTDGSRASSCVDGITDPDGTDVSVCRSQAELRPWLKVQLLRGSRVVLVVVWTPGDCCTGPRVPFWMRLLDPHNGTIAERRFAQTLRRYEWPVGYSNVGYVQVQLDGTSPDPLTLAEVEAFGTLATLSPTASHTATGTCTTTRSAASTRTGTPTLSRTPTATVSHTATGSATPTNTGTPPASFTSAPTPTPTSTAILTHTATSTATPSAAPTRTGCVPWSASFRSSAEMTVEGWDLRGMEYTKERHALLQCSTNVAQWYGWNGGAWRVGAVRYRFQTPGMAVLDFGNCWSAGYVVASLNGVVLGWAMPWVRSVRLRFGVRFHDLLELVDGGYNSVILLTSLTVECDDTPTRTCTPTPPLTLTRPPTRSITPSPSSVGTHSPTCSPTLRLTSTPVMTSSSTMTSTPTRSPTGVWTPLPTFSPTATLTGTPTPTPTPTSSSTVTLTPEVVWRMAIAAVPQPHFSSQVLYLNAILGLSDGRAVPCIGGNITDWMITWEVTGTGTALHYTDTLGISLNQFSAPQLRITVVATLPASGTVVQDSMVLRIHFPPAAPRDSIAITAAPGPVVAGSSTIALSVPPRVWSALSDASLPLEFLFVVQSSAGSLLRIAAHPTFSAGREVRFTVPWLPRRRTGPQEYSFAVFVRDALGLEAGPFPAHGAVTVQSPTACPASCPDVGLRVEYVACVTCGGQVPGNAVHRGLVEYVRRPLADPFAAQWLLRDLSYLCSEFSLEAPGLRTAVAEALLTAVTPHLQREALVPLLYDALSAVLYPPGLADGAEAALRLFADAHAAAWAPMAVQCSPPPLQAQSAGIATHTQRLPIAELPLVLRAGAVRVHLPQSLPAVLAATATSTAVDVTVTVTRGPPPLVADVVTVVFVDPVTGAEVPLSELADPVAIVFAPGAASALRRPLADWYQCVYEDDGGWSPEGTWLVNTSVADAVVCHTTHLSSFSLQPLVRVQAVRGCGLGLGPTALFCPPQSTVLTVSGGNFGAEGAKVVLREHVEAGGGAHWQCPVVTHVRGAEQSSVVCAQPRAPLGPRTEAQWVDVEVVTGHGLAGLLRRALLIAGTPTLTGLTPLGPADAACRAAGPYALAHCPLDGAAFGVTGSGLLGYAGTTIRVGPYKCPEVVVHSDTYLECHLLSGDGVAHAVTVTVGGIAATAVVAGPGPRFTVSFVGDCSMKDGFWTGRACDACAPSYYGPGCDRQCPGSRAGLDGAPPTVCSGHGTCDGGTAGTGGCSCDGISGQWAGTDCGECQAGWYGTNCRSRCPTADVLGTGSVETCGGHGTCDDGVIGSGRCRCRDFWAGIDCSTCNTGYYGLDCQGRCPETTAGVCAGHGVCRDGRSGDGVCMCDAGYADRACDSLCPTAAGGLCNGIGRCMTDTWECDCSAAPQGHWQGIACTACQPGWVGPTCDVRCPRGAAGVACAGVGECNLVSAGSVARCDCAPGFFSATCEGICPGGALLPCGGHGACDAGTGVCECEQSPGHWSGIACQECSPGWSGPHCALECPVGAGGLPCSGLPCMSGVCFCGAGRCGRACDSTGSDCNTVCPDGTPLGLAGEPCSSRGGCAPTPDGAGACYCHRGYAGVACQLVCPGPRNRPCGGHGLCDALDATCACYTGYATVDCSVPCPMAFGYICAGHGQCSDGARGDGLCLCDAGYGLSACDGACPVAGNVSCGGHGRCEQATARCVCVQDEGVWAGLACDACAIGWFGEGCARRCHNGRTEGQVCVCAPGYGAADCGVACPGPAGHHCFGHGQCLDGHTRDASCACDPQWYGTDCAVFCDPPKCFRAEAYPAPRAVCNQNTGMCECQRNASGQWDGPECNACLTGYWGLECDLRCDCNGHGGCGWLDGVCRCFQDPLHGFWAGELCGVCADGYLEPECRERNVAISRPREFAAVSEFSGDALSAIVTDEEHRLVYTGGLPLLYFSSEDDSILGHFSLGGIVKSGCVTRRAVNFLVQNEGSQELTLVTISRGRRPQKLHAIPTNQSVSGQHHKWRAQGVAPTLFMELFTVEDQVHAVLFTDGAAVLLVFSEGALLSRTHIPGHALQLHSVRSIAVWRAPPNRTAVYIAGAWDAEWQVTELRLPLRGPPVPLRAALAPQLPRCRSDGCAAAGAVAVHNSTLFLALEQRQGLLFAKVDLWGWRVVRSAPVDGAGDWPSVCDMTLDPVTAAVFVATNVPSGPSLVYKINSTSLMPYGISHMRKRGGAQERVYALQQDAMLRRLYALTRVGDQPLIVIFVMYAVIGIDPTVVDAAGGTKLSITAEGLQDLGFTECYFAGGLTTPATMSSPSVVECRAPFTNSTTDACTMEALELQLLPGLTTENGVQLRRVATPSVRTVLPDRGFYSESRWVVVRGYGFVGTKYLACHFTAGGKYSVIVRGPQRVRFRSTTEVECYQPDLSHLGPFPDPSYLEVSLDGQTFSRSEVKYTLVGPAVAMQASLQSVRVRAGAATALPEIVIYTVDQSGNHVLNWDTNDYAVAAEVHRLSDTNALNISGGAERFAEGKAAFKSIVLHRPEAGGYTICVESPLGIMRPLIEVTVTEGWPAMLHILQEPSTETNNVDLLEDQPILELWDEAHNRVELVPTNTTLIRVHACVHPQAINAEEYEKVFENGEFAFRDIKIVGGYGYEYRLTFYIEPVNGREIANATSRPIRPRPCTKSQFYVRGNTSCSDCVTGAKCNGTDVLLTQDNYWRKAGSLVFVKCEEVMGVRGKPACLGDFPVGTCSEGFTGITCALCEPGRSGPSCAECGSKWLAWLGILCVLCGYFCLIAFACFRALRADPSGRSDVEIKVFKILVTYLQTLSIVQSIFPDFVRLIIEPSGSVFSFGLPPGLSECASDSLTTFTMFYAHMAMPVLSFLLLSLLIWYDKSLGCRDPVRAAVLTKEQQKQMRDKSLTKGRDYVTMSIVALSTTLYFLYSGLMTHNAEMQDCVTIDFGSSPDFDYGKQTLLTTNFAVDCGDKQYLRVKYISIVFTVGYGVGIPLAFNIVGLVQRLRHAGKAMEQATFAFLFAGYKWDYRYWETLNMVRKLMVIVATTFVAEVHLRIYLCMWIVLFFAALTYFNQPFESAVTNRLEITSLLIIAAVLNLSLLQFSPYWDPAHSGVHVGLHILLGITILVLQMSIVLGSIVVVSANMRDRFRHIRRHFAEQKRRYMLSMSPRNSVGNTEEMTDRDRFPTIDSSALEKQMDKRLSAVSVARSKVHFRCPTGELDSDTDDGSDSGIPTEYSASMSLWRFDSDRQCSVDSTRTQSPRRGSCPSPGVVAVSTRSESPRGAAADAAPDAPFSLAGGPHRSLPHVLIQHPSLHHTAHCPTDPRRDSSQASSPGPELDHAAQPCTRSPPTSGPSSSLHSDSADAMSDSSLGPVSNKMLSPRPTTRVISHRGLRRCIGDEPGPRHPLPEPRSHTAPSPANPPRPLSAPHATRHSSLPQSPRSQIAGTVCAVTARRPANARPHTTSHPQRPLTALYHPFAIVDVDPGFSGGGDWEQVSLHGDHSPSTDCYTPTGSLCGRTLSWATPSGRPLSSGSREQAAACRSQTATTSIRHETPGQSSTGPGAARVSSASTLCLTHR